MKRVLIVDDDPEIISLVTYILNSSGYQVVPSSRLSLVQDIYRYRPGLILYDNWKNNDQEILLLRQLKKDRNTSTIPVVLFSTAPNLTELATLCETDYFLAKPFDIDELTTTVDSVFLSPPLPN